VEVPLRTDILEVIEAFHGPILEAMEAFHGPILEVMETFHGPILEVLEAFHGPILEVMEAFHGPILEVMEAFHGPILEVLEAFHGPILEVMEAFHGPIQSLQTISRTATHISLPLCNPTLGSFGADTASLNYKRIGRNPLLLSGTRQLDVTPTGAPNITFCPHRTGPHSDLRM
jgi:hypothetical protein